MVNFTIINVIRIILLCVMLFSFGIMQDVSYKTKEIAKNIWLVSIILIFIVAILN